jgi:hypothetical protein
MLSALLLNVLKDWHKRGAIIVLAVWRRLEVFRTIKSSVVALFSFNPTKIKFSAPKFQNTSPLILVTLKKLLSGAIVNKLQSRKLIFTLNNFEESSDIDLYYYN